MSREDGGPHLVLVVVVAVLVVCAVVFQTWHYRHCRIWWMKHLVPVFCIPR